MSLLLWGCIQVQSSFITYKHRVIRVHSRSAIICYTQAYCYKGVFKASRHFVTHELTDIRVYSGSVVILLFMSLLLLGCIQGQSSCCYTWAYCYKGVFKVSHHLLHMSLLLWECIQGQMNYLTWFGITGLWFVSCVFSRGLPPFGVSEMKYLTWLDWV